MDAYINLKYFNKRIQINYSLSVDIRNNFRTVGITSSSGDFEEAKTRLQALVKNSHEEKIIIKSRLSRIRGYSRMGYRRLKEVKDLLSNQRPDITFKLTA